MDQHPLESKAQTESTLDRIQKRTVVRASPTRVWRALTQTEEFGTWFGAKLTGQFVPGSTVRGPISHKGYEHVTIEIQVERMDPERLLAFRWHPFAVDPAVDYASEPTTLVTFELAAHPEGTSLVVTESGFSQIPAGRRSLAFRMNDQGWGKQIENIARHLLQTPG